MQATWRQRFDRIEIIDLRGDVRRGERAGVEGDQGVFNIQVGTCIMLAVADGSKAADELADVAYTDTWAEERFAREAKLDWLRDGAGKGQIAGAFTVERSRLDDMKPKPFQATDWPSLADCLLFKWSGVQTKDDDNLVRVRQADLRPSILALLPAGAQATYQPAFERGYAYRPLDHRWLYNDSRLVKRQRPELQAVWGQSNTALYAMPFATCAGPAVWCHGLLPDYHAFRGSYGGYAFPLQDNRPGHGPSNVSQHLLDGLTDSYSVAVSAQDVFDCMLALLSATSYTLRFAEDLEDVFPHVPFPADHALFVQAVAIGQEIRAVQCFSRPPSPAFLSRTVARMETEALQPLNACSLVDGGLFLCADRSGRLSGISEEIYSFAVSGYRLVPRWLAAREGLPVDNAMVLALRDLVGRIGELIDLFARADTILSEVLRHTLSRADLLIETPETLKTNTDD